MVVDNGWSGVILAHGNAYIKKVDYHLKKEHLNSCGACDAWIYDAPKNTNTEEEEAEEDTGTWTEYNGLDFLGRGKADQIFRIGSWKSKFSWSEL